MCNQPERLSEREERRVNEKDSFFHPSIHLFTRSLPSSFIPSSLPPPLPSWWSSSSLSIISLLPFINVPLTIIIMALVTWFAILFNVFSSRSFRYFCICIWKMKQNRRNRRRETVKSWKEWEWMRRKANKDVERKLWEWSLTRNVFLPFKWVLFSIFPFFLLLLYLYLISAFFCNHTSSPPLLSSITSSPVMIIRGICSASQPPSLPPPPYISCMVLFIEKWRDDQVLGMRQ